MNANRDLTIPLILLAHKALEIGPRKYVEPCTCDFDPSHGGAPNCAVHPAVIESDDPCDAEQFFLEEQCPSDSSFR